MVPFFFLVFEEAYTFDSEHERGLADNHIIKQINSRCELSIMMKAYCAH